MTVSGASINHKKDRAVVIIAGGGTGGHIYPGVAIARTLQSLHPEIDVHFVGASGGLEEKIIPRENFPLHTVPIGKLHHTAGFFVRLKTLLKLPLAFFAALKILCTLKPIAVLGVGGFASGPMLFVASLFGYRSLIWEPNAFPGMTNRLLARRVDECLLVFEDARKYLRAKKITVSGIPVRAGMTPVGRDAGPRPLRILVFGGSQGAHYINNLVSESLPLHGWLEGVEVVHQTGPSDFARLQKIYAEAPANHLSHRVSDASGSFEVFEYLHDMDRRLAWADLVVCRSGASTVAEVCACQKAAIFIPLPTAADDHQRKNAEVLAQAGAAVMLLQSNLDAEKFRAVLISFRDDRGRIAILEENVRRFQFPRAAEKIVERILDRSV